MSGMEGLAKAVEGHAVTVTTQATAEKIFIGKRTVLLESAVTNTGIIYVSYSTEYEDNPRPATKTERFAQLGAGDARIYQAPKDKQIINLFVYGSVATDLINYEASDGEIIPQYSNERAFNPTIYNVTLTNADTEYSQALPTATKKYEMHLRDGTSFRLAFVAGKVGGSVAPFWTQAANSEQGEENVHLVNVTLYFACAVAGKIMEIKAWT